jgi:hypothetical protein
MAVAVLALPGAAAASEALREAKAPAAELAKDGSVESFGIDIDRYQQEVGGVPVIGSQAVVADGPGERAGVVADSTTTGIANPAEPEIGSAEAVRTARSSAGTKALRAPARAELAIDPDSAGGRQVWRVLIPSLRPFADFEVLVDAASGAVVSRRDVLQRVQGRAKVFVVNPVTLNGGSTGLADNGDQDSALLTSLRQPVVLQHLRKKSKCLDGAFAHAFLGSKTEVCSKSRRWGRLTRAEDGFEAANAYEAVDRTQTYVRLLGLPRQIGYRRIPLRTNRGKADNSAFSFFTRDITFGRGGVDDAEDSDVVIHEYAHSLQDSQVSDFGMNEQGMAIGEGFGDYIAAVMTAVVPGTSAEAAACIFDWDSNPLGIPCLRRTDLSETLADANASPSCATDPHCVGQVWSSALWKLRGELGADSTGQSAMDKIVLQANFLITADARFRDAANALLAADSQLYGGAHATPITAELTTRGFLP